MKGFLKKWIIKSEYAENIPWGLTSNQENFVATSLANHMWWLIYGQKGHLVTYSKIILDF